MKYQALTFLLLFYCVKLCAADIILNRKSGTVWQATQSISGKLEGFIANSVTITHNSRVFDVGVSGSGEFRFEVSLLKGSNTIVAKFSTNGATYSSQKLELVLPYQPFPTIIVSAEPEGRSGVRLAPVMVEQMPQVPLSYEWKAASGNPAKTILETPGDSTTLVSLPSDTGDYYFTLYVRWGDVVDSFKTYVTVSQAGIRPFNIQDDHAAWIERAIIYQVTPYIFTNRRMLSDITRRLNELSQLGINTLYLQPIFKTARGGQGYDVIDFFSMRGDVGSENDLRTLIAQAKALNMRVLFDMVPNHTSIEHPYAKDVITNGKNSAYYDFYQTQRDNAKYSRHYHNRGEGFIYYFWTELVNLNYNNEEVQRWMIEACKYWVRKYDIDGYRFDAVWGVNARTPQFARRLRTELKSLKPDIFLLAEDKASFAETYRLGFDAAYDWDKSEEWVSKWAWQYEFDEDHSHTVFNHPSPGERKRLLQNALFSDGDSIGLRLRYLENNDLHRFISNHSRDVTKMAASMMFALNGIPMLYNGQETGFRLFPYNSGPIYDSSRAIRTYDPDLFDFYKRLITTRKKFSALTNGSMREISLNDAPGCIAFSRKYGEEEIIVIVNMSNTSLNPALVLPGNESEYISLTDVIGDDSIVARKQTNGYRINVDAFSTRILLLNGSTTPSGNAALMKVMPNPSTGNCVVQYEMQNEGMLNLTVTDVSGKIIQRTSRRLPAGNSTFPLVLTNTSTNTCYVMAHDGVNKSCVKLMLIRR